MKHAQIHQVTGTEERSAEAAAQTTMTDHEEVVPDQRLAASEDVREEAALKSSWPGPLKDQKAAVQDAPDGFKQLIYVDLERPCTIT